jgi:serine phosphatase RsbU (regulator of sigma subunit)
MESMIIYHRSLRLIPRFNLLCAFLLLQFTAVAKEINRDSLLAIYSNKSNIDTLRLDAIHDLAYSYVNTFPDSALMYARLEFPMAEKSKNPLDLGRVCNTMAICFFYLVQYDSAHYYYDKGFNIYKKLGDFKNMGALRMNDAGAYAREGKLLYASDCFYEAIEYAKNAKDTFTLSGSYMGLGVIHRMLGNYDRAIANQRHAADLAADQGNHQLISVVFNNIAVIYNNLSRGDSARIYVDEALFHGIADDNKREIARSYLILADIFDDKNLDSCVYYAHKAIQLRTEMNEFAALSSPHNILAHAWLDNHNLDSAYYNVRKSLQYQQQNSYRNTDDLILSYQILSEIQFKRGQYKDAYLTIVRLLEIKDSVLESDNAATLLQKELAFEYKLEKNADSILHAQELVKIELESENNRALAEAASHRNVIVITAGSLLLILILIIVVVLYRSNQQKKKDNAFISQQKLEVEEKNREIIDSITYARRIQAAILPTPETMNQALPENFVVYLPKDIVAGDFYWLEKQNNLIHVAAADCTGHGVPGALVSVVCHNALNRSVREFKLSDPAKILDKTRELVIETFEKSSENVKDGMDISFCSIDLQLKKLSFSGANNPCWIVNANDVTTNIDGSVIEIKADKQPIGKFDHARPFTSHQQNLRTGDMIYLFSDGYADQFGGEKGKKFKYRALQQILSGICMLPLEDQKLTLEREFEAWKGSYEQVDDVCIIGIRI